MITHQPTQTLLDLARDFGFGHEALQAVVDGRFDPDAFLPCSGPWSSGERQIVAFLLAVWNPARFSSQFNLMDFAATVDAESRAPLGRWLAQPTWP